MTASLNAKIPFQPGLALGSIVRGDIVQQMELYAQMNSQVEQVQKELRDLEQGVKTLDAKIQSLKTKQTQGPIDNTLIDLYQKQQDAFQEQIKQLPKKLEKVRQIEIPAFSNLSTGLESPFDFDHTQTAIDKRGFDSITYSSQYIDMAQSSQKIQDRMNQSSSAHTASGGGGYGLFFSASASHTWSEGAMNRVAEIRNQGFASKVLLINALVTTRYVRFFKNRTYDPNKLQAILRAMRATNDPVELKRVGVTVVENTETQKATKCVYLLTEAVMGGSFSAILTYLKEDSSQRDVKSEAKHSGEATEVDISGGWGPFQAKGGYGHSGQKADESTSDEIQNRSNLNLSIEFIAQGAVPQLARDTVIREVMKHQDQNLRTYTSSGSQQKGQSAYERQAELQKAMYASLNAVQKTTVQEEKIQIHSPNNVLKAYDDFCGEIVSDTSCGIPIGFNYTQLNEEQIAQLVGSDKAEKSDKTAKSDKTEKND